MKWLMIVGVVLMLVGGALMVKGFVTVEDKHEVNVLGAELSVTETDRKAIPMALSGTLLGVGALLTVIAAVRSRAR
jgi:hypothetical protein